MIAPLLISGPLRTMIRKLRSLDCKVPAYLKSDINPGVAIFEDWSIPILKYFDAGMKGVG
jgi:hypothetical protein